MTDKEKQRIRSKRWYDNNRDLAIKRSKSWDSEHPEEVKARSKKWSDENPNYPKEYYLKNAEEKKSYQRDYGKRKRLELRLAVLEKYGNRCVCCGETEEKFLALDHVNGGGSKERKSTGYSTLRWYSNLLKNKREDIQILCHNCNHAKSLYGICPHQKVPE